MECKSLDCILERLPKRIADPLRTLRSAYEDKVTEIVLRAERPVCIYQRNGMTFLTKNECLTDSLRDDELLMMSSKEIEQTVLQMCDYSVYAHQNEINDGFLTIEGGVRVGLCGKAVVTDGRINTVRDIGTLSFRVSRDIPRCADLLIQSTDATKGVLICGEPGSGKTTLIRDMARTLSFRHRISVLDERGELSAFFRGSAGFSLGLCDVYTGYPKGLAASYALRSMSPEIIVCDELGDDRDVQMLINAMRCGAAFIATLHAASMSDLKQRELSLRLLKTGAFGSIVFLRDRDEVGRIEKIYEM